MKVWLVLLTGRRNPCYECGGGGDADYWFVAAPSRREAIAIPRRFRELRVRNDYQLHDKPLPVWVQAEVGLDDQWKATPVRNWRGKTARILSEREVER